MSKTRPLILLKTMAEVDAALGGTVATARVTGKSAQSISNAKRRGYYPRDTYAAMQDELFLLGYRGDPAIWRQVDPSQEGAAA